MNEKIVIITGANSGIGKAATIKFCQEGHVVVMACRNLVKSKLVYDEIVNSTNNSKLDLMELDISSFSSIKNFSKEFKTKYNHLDILIHNAGCFNHGEKQYQLSSDNIELTFATNTFGPVYLTNLLLESLKKSSDARVLNACSTNIRHFFEPKRKIDFNNLQKENPNKYNSYKMYGDSKMASLMLTIKLAEIYKEDLIKVNAVQIPAIKISKETIKKLKPAWRLAGRIQSLFSAKPQTMANTYYHITTSNDFKDITGKLINDERKIMIPSFYSTGLVQSIKQLFDKNVYPKYAIDLDNINLLWNYTISLFKEKIK